jgi:hypothetical protein
VSGIELSEINKMEREFLLGVDFGLFVDKATSESWQNLLKGLVMAKERDSQWWRRSRASARSSRAIGGAYSYHAVSPSHQTSWPTRGRPMYHRARSSSPPSTACFCPPTFRPNPQYYAPSNSTQTAQSRPLPATTLPPLVHRAQAPPPLSSPEHSPHPRSGSKRNASAAFSPTSETFLMADAPPTKRPIAISLEIPPPRSGPPSASSASGHSPEPLRSFARMSLGPAAGVGSVSNSPMGKMSPCVLGGVQAKTALPGNDASATQTLASAFRFDEKTSAHVPEVSRHPQIRFFLFWHF